LKSFTFSVLLSLSKHEPFGFPFALRLSKGEVHSASGSGSAPASGSESPPARRERLLPRRESLWLGEDTLVEAWKVALCNKLRNAHFL